jgi:phage shock protein E
MSKTKGETIIVYCRSGRRSGIAKTFLDEMGYIKVTDGGAYAKLKKKEEN